MIYRFLNKFLQTWPNALYVSKYRKCISTSFGQTRGLGSRLIQYNLIVFSTNKINDNIQGTSLTVPPLVTRKQYSKNVGRGVFILIVVYFQNTKVNMGRHFFGFYTTFSTFCFWFVFYTNLFSHNWRSKFKFVWTLNGFFTPVVGVIRVILILIYTLFYKKSAFQIVLLSSCFVNLRLFWWIKSTLKLL